MDISAYTVYTKLEILDEIKNAIGNYGMSVHYLSSLVSQGIVSINEGPIDHCSVFYLSNPVDLEIKVKEWAASEADNA